MSTNFDRVDKNKRVKTNKNTRETKHAHLCDIIKLGNNSSRKSKMF